MALAKRALPRAGATATVSTVTTTRTLHPVVAFGAVLLGGAVLGAIGAFVALPVAATVQAIVSLELKRHRVVESELTHEASGDQPTRLTKLRDWWDEAGRDSG
jgi:CBS-domain-containing membrane protein